MNHLSGFLELLKEPAKILSKNGKLMAFIATLYLILSSISFILNTSSISPFIYDVAFKILALASAHPGTPEYTQLLVAIRQDIGFFLGIETAYIVLYFFIGLFTRTAIIFIASSYYNGDNLSIKELILKVSRTWTRPFVTSFYVELLALGYTSFFFLPFLVPTLILYDHHALIITLLVILAILFITFYLYLYVVWGLAVVVSVVEDSYGISALGKARELVKGKRVHGFLLNLLVNLVVMIIMMVGLKLSPVMPIVVGVIQGLLTCVVSMFLTMAYSVLYFQCKKNMKISEGLEYNPIPTRAPVLDDDLP